MAVKVLDRWMEPTSDEGEVPRRGPMLEALLSKQLPHPHIVQTYEYATKVEQVRRMLRACVRAHATDGHCTCAARISALHLQSREGGARHVSCVSWLDGVDEGSAEG